MTAAYPTVTRRAATAAVVSMAVVAACLASGCGTHRGSSPTAGSGAPTGRPTYDFRTPLPPLNQGSGPCHDPKFTIELATPVDHVFHTRETLSVDVAYDAPGCTSMRGAFGVRHQAGSPRYDRYCQNFSPVGQFDLCRNGLTGEISAKPVDLTSPAGKVTLVAQPGTFPPTDASSPPDLEGAQVCLVVLTVSDGRPSGSLASQQINVACPENYYTHDDLTPRPTPARTPSISSDLITPAVFMFCDPLQQPGQSGHGQPIAVVPDGSSVVYRPHSCDPDVDAAGTIPVRDTSGTIKRVAPNYVQRAERLPDQIVWTPALGVLNGASVVMTAVFLQHDATLERDSIGRPIALLTTTDDGAQVLGSITESIGDPSNGLPLATFVDGAPLRTRDGSVLAPVVQSKITTHLALTGLLEADAQRIVDLLNKGDLR